MIYCIWYPSGGFGHYFNAILSVYGHKFARPKQHLTFSSTGDAHALDLVLPKYWHNPQTYNLPKLDQHTNYSLLIDNGIDDESDVFKTFFPNQTYIKICYCDRTWPIIAKSHIQKAMKVAMEDALPIHNSWPKKTDWSVREKYFLYLRDHAFRQSWRSDPDCENLSMSILCDYKKLYRTLKDIGIICDDFEALHYQMLQVNHEYFVPVNLARDVISALTTKQNMDLTHITDFWDQAVINYFIQLEFGLEIPANDYANWFANTIEIQELL